MGRYPSGQREQTVNLPAYAYVGSNPSRPTMYNKVLTESFCYSDSISTASGNRRYALLAHSVEHFHGKEEVAGSIPAEGS